ncbi:MAG TPA: selenide, water dikinase SelD [Terriglobia bacterium]|nr:selenide, water dikinase SelD [Terriglobia bacterium]
MSPSILDSVLAKLPKQTDPNVLVGFETADDAAVYRLTHDLALVQTVDFFTPIVDEPYTFGQIAAANSLSDVYAMGGRPISALSIVAFPGAGRDVDILEAIVRGGLAKMQEAGCAVVGGHSIADEEIKFGYAVTGVVHPAHFWSNAKARPGDRLILTKRIGTGVISTAIKQQRAAADSVSAAVESMLTLNRAASEVALEFEIHSATDVTGFGLLGHAREMAVGSKVSLILDHSRIEFLPEALEDSKRGFLPGGLKRNIEFLAGCVEFADGISQEVRNLLFDPQTSGGLLLSVATQDAPALLEALRARDIPAQEIGAVIEKTQPLIQVR